MKMELIEELDGSESYNELLIKYDKLLMKHRVLCKNYILLSKQHHNLVEIMEINLKGDINEGNK